MNHVALITQSTNNSTSSTDLTASLAVKGGISVAKDVQVGGTLVYASIRTTGAAFQMNTSTLTLSSTDGYYMIECVFAGSATITLPLASTCPGKQYFIIKQSLIANTLAINVSGSDTVDGTDTSITALSSPNQRVKLTSNGIATWYTG